MTLLYVECSSIVFDCVDSCLTNSTRHAYSVLGILYFRVWVLDCQQPAAAGGFAGFEASLLVVPCKSDVVKHAATAD